MHFTLYGLGCALGMGLGLLACALWHRYRGIGAEAPLALCLTVIPLAWLGGRLLFVGCDLFASLFGSSFYLDTVGSALPALRFWEGGYSLMGAVLGALLGARLAERAGADRDGLAFGLPVAVLVERLFETGTGLGLGKSETGGWPLNVWVFHHPDYAPVYLYEALTMLLLLALMLALAGKKRERGDLLRIFLALWGLAQVLLESLRSDHHMEYHFVKAQQVMAILLALGPAVVWSARAAKKHGARGVAAGWALILAAVGGAVAAEFGVDRWGRPLLAYLLMTACLAVIGLVVFHFRKKALN